MCSLTIIVLPYSDYSCLKPLSHRQSKTLHAPEFGFYVYFVLGITILSREVGTTYIIRWIPFTTWGTDLENLSLWIENILMMIPLGILLYILWKPCRRLGMSILVGGIFSLIIECIQLFMRLGKFETDDIMNNVFGTLIGFGICKGISALGAVSAQS